MSILMKSKGQIGDIEQQKLNIAKHGRIDIVGLTFGDWYVESKAPSKNKKAYYNCICSCGIKREVCGQSLRHGRSTNCGHKKDTPANFIDLTDQTYGNWYVNGLAPSRNGNAYWVCTCSCGIEREVSGSSLRNGESTSCGHASANLIDLTGQTFGDWYVKGPAKTINKVTYWLCDCLCGTERWVSGAELKRGKSRSCGHAIDLTDHVYGNLKVLYKISGKLWMCECICGNFVQVLSYNLRTGNTSSCGHCGRQNRQQWQIDATRDEIKFKASLTELADKLKRKPTIKQASDFLGLNNNGSSLAYCLDKYNAWNYVLRLSGTSAIEGEIVDYIESFNIKVEKHNRNIIKPLELDIYIPDKNIAIEVNGSYWHSIERKEKGYHQRKTLLCLEKGIQLIHIFEHEWNKLDIREKLKAYIRKLVLNQHNIIYARNTELREIKDVNTVVEFEAQNHLQGHAVYQIVYGLYYNNELIELMTFGKPRFNDSYDYELIRLCTKQNYIIVGGASKLFNYFKNTHPKVSVISYCDISKFTGKVYEKFGFKYDGLTAPNYTYVNLSDLHTLSRMQCQKHKLVEQGWGTLDQTEKQIMLNRNYVQVYDCGNARYVYNRKESL